MYEGCMIYRFAGFPIYAADNRPFKNKRTREDALFLPSYINCTSYIVPSYIFLAIFCFFICIYQKLLLILQPDLRRSRFYAAEGGGFFTY